MVCICFEFSKVILWSNIAKILMYSILLSSRLHLSFLEFPSNLISVLFKFLIHIFEIWSFLIFFVLQGLIIYLKNNTAHKSENLPQTVSIKLFLLKHHISYLENLYLQLPFPPHTEQIRGCLAMIQTLEIFSLPHW